MPNARPPVACWGEGGARVTRLVGGSEPEETITLEGRRRAESGRRLVLPGHSSQSVGYNQGIASSLSMAVCARPRQLIGGVMPGASAPRSRFSLAEGTTCLALRHPRWVPQFPQGGFGEPIQPSLDEVRFVALIDRSERPS